MYNEDSTDAVSMRKEVIELPAYYSKQDIQLAALQGIREFAQNPTSKYNTNSYLVTIKVKKL